MRWLKRGLKALAVLAVVVVSWLAVVVSGWLPRPTAEELAALEALRPEPANVRGERDAFAILYSFDRDIPEDQWEAVAAADLEAYERQRRDGGEGFRPLNDSPYPTFPDVPANHPGLCGAWTPDCLPRVRAHLDEVRDLVLRGAGQLARGERLAEYDHYRYRPEPDFNSPTSFPVRGYLALVLSAAALDHIDGDSERAFERVCTTAATWRRLRAHSDVLIVDMIGVAVLAGATRLYAEMAAEMPSGFEPPCAEAFAALTDAELDQCATFRHEYLMFENTLRDDTSSLSPTDPGNGLDLRALVLDTLWNREHLLRVVARSIGVYCQAAHRQRIAGRSPDPLPEFRPCPRAHLAVDPVGCWFAASSLPNYGEYYLRALDLDGRLRLLGTALWLRQHAGDDPQAAFDARPPELHSPRHGFTLDAAAGTVRMRPHDQKRGEYWEFPYRAAAPEQR